LPTANWTSCRDWPVKLRVDVILTGGSNDATAAKNATQTIPIVFSGAVSDPVGAGLVSSLARPGGNITGFTTIATDLSGKRLELLKDAVPKLGRVAVLWDPRKRRRRVAVERTSVGGQSAGRAAPFDGGVEPRSI
jgi:putative ABC transport system substrate-binding protein